VGPTTASILATVEPLVTVLLAFLVFGERLGPVQILGGSLVLAAVLVLHAGAFGTIRRRAALAES
jgi:drug/metabolite transporter (DMT)-like permease